MNSTIIDGVWSTYPGKQVTNIGYCKFAATAWLVYDYVLTFSDEVYFIWQRPWGIVSILYLIVRYMPMAILSISLAVNIRSDISFNLCTSWTWIEAISTIAIFIFVGIICQFRLYAMYNKSRAILYSNAILFVVELTISGGLLAKFFPMTIQFHDSPYVYGSCFALSKPVMPVVMTPSFLYESYLAFLAVRISWNKSKILKHVVQRVGLPLSAVAHRTRNSAASLLIPNFQTLPTGNAVRLEIGDKANSKSPPPHMANLNTMNAPGNEPILASGKVGAKIDLMSILVRDSVVYFFLEAGTLVVVMLVWAFLPLSPGNSIISLTHASGSIGGCRLIVSIRRAALDRSKSSLPTSLVDSEADTMIHGPGPQTCPSVDVTITPPSAAKLAQASGPSTTVILGRSYKDVYGFGGSRVSSRVPSRVNTPAHSRHPSSDWLPMRSSSRFSGSGFGSFEHDRGCDGGLGCICDLDNAPLDLDLELGSIDAHSNDASTTCDREEDGYTPIPRRASRQCSFLNGRGPRRSLRFSCHTRPGTASSLDGLIPPVPPLPVAAVPDMEGDVRVVERTGASDSSSSSRMSDDLVLRICSTIRALEENTSGNAAPSHSGETRTC